MLCDTERRDQQSECSPLRRSRWPERVARERREIDKQLGRSPPIISREYDAMVTAVAQCSTDQQDLTALSGSGQPRGWRRRGVPPHDLPGA
jgi:hypothetical protein